MLKNPFKKRSTLMILAVLVMLSVAASVLVPLIGDETTRKIAENARWMVYGLLVGFFISRDFREDKNDRADGGQA